MRGCKQLPELLRHACGRKQRAKDVEWAMTQVAVYLSESGSNFETVSAGLLMLKRKVLQMMRGGNAW